VYVGARTKNFSLQLKRSMVFKPTIFPCTARDAIDYSMAGKNGEKRLCTIG